MEFATPRYQAEADEASDPIVAPAAAAVPPADGAAPSQATAAAPARRAAQAAQRPTTNVLRLDLAEAIQQASYSSRTPVLCGCCGAIMSAFSKVELEGAAAAPEAATPRAPAEAAAVDAEAYTWPCEHCGSRNTGLLLTPAELPAALLAAAAGGGSTASPRVSTTGYVVVPPPAAAAAAAAAGAGSEAAAAPPDTGVVVFVLDTSGSMGLQESITPSVAQRLQPLLGQGGDAQRQHQLEMLVAAGIPRAEAEAHLRSAGLRHGPSRMSSITRLQAVQAAVVHEVQGMARDRGTKRAALVTFDSKVKVHTPGPASLRVTTIAEHHYGNEPALLDAADAVSLDTPVSAGAAQLVSATRALTEDGCTALGPALLVAVQLAGRFPGGKVIVLTDGMANVGLGSLERGGRGPAANVPADDKPDPVAAFYSAVASRARTAGVVVDVLGFEGAQCNLEALGSIAEATSGNVSRVRPSAILDTFGDVLADAVLASDCNVSVLGHPALALLDPAAAPPEPRPAPVPTTPLPTPLPAAAQQAVSAAAAVYGLTPDSTGVLARFAALTVADPADAEAAAGGAGAAPLPCKVGRAAVTHASPASEPAAPVPAEAAAAPAAPAAPAPHELSRVFISVGNVTRSTEITVEYSQKPMRVLPPALAAEVRTLSSLPFQAQLAFRRADGAVCLVVVSASQAVARPRRHPLVPRCPAMGGTEGAAGLGGAADEAEEEEAPPVYNARALLSHASRVSAAQARRGQYAKASFTLAAYSELMEDALSREVTPAAPGAPGGQVMSPAASEYVTWRADAMHLQTSLVSEMASEGRAAPKSGLRMLRSGMGSFGSASAVPYGAPFAAPTPFAAPVTAVIPPVAPGAPARTTSSRSLSFNLFRSARPAAQAQEQQQFVVPPAPVGGAGAAADDEDGEDDATAIEAEEAGVLPAAGPTGASMDSAAFLSASRATRRAANDELSAQLYNMRKGAKRLATPKL